MKLVNTNPELQAVYTDLINTVAVAEDALKLADFIPTRGSILVEALPPDEVTKGGLIIPQDAQVDKAAGRVIAINPADKDGPYEVGDLVYFAFGAGDTIRIEGKPVIVIQYPLDGSAGEILGKWPRAKVPAAKVPAASGV